MDIENKLRTIIAEQLSVSAEKVTLNAEFVSELGADSLDLVELSMAMEEAFDTEIPDADAEKITNLKKAIEYMKNIQ